MDQILKAYPQQVRFVYKEFPLISIHQYALNAARAAVAAQQQSKFWKMHDALFANQRALDTDSLKKYAQDIGLDVPRFEDAMASPKTQQEIAADMQLASRLDVRGTPTFFLDGKLVTNRNFDNVKQLIDAAIRKKTGSS